MAEQPPPSIEISRTSTESRAGSSKSCPVPTPQRPSTPRLNTASTFSPSVHDRRTASWESRKRGVGIPWRKHLTPTSFPRGRVLLIDYISNERTTETHLAEGNTKKHLAVAAQEFENLDELKEFYADPHHINQAALRVIHVQNATWAVDHLLKRFNIDHPSELVGMEGFNKWARYERPRQRNGKPFPSGRSWRTQLDPWRNVNRTAFGLDYLKRYHTPVPAGEHQYPHAGRPRDAQFMHLNAYEDDKNPFGYDVSVQRLSVYVQRNLGESGRISPEDDFKSPYSRHEMSGHRPRKPNLDQGLDFEALDNTNTIIVFETSASMLLGDCLIQPRNDFENRWRRLSFYLNREEALDDHRLATKCANIILNDIFHGLSMAWESFLDAASDHVSLLEEKIYDNPADESRAPELWTNQAAWLKVDKVMYTHKDLVAELQGHMKDMTEDLEQEEDWLAASTAEYDKLGHRVEEDLARPTNNLSDLVYKSVAIRDSRQSLQLGLSMWRLSWITFIFLPLTFIVGFFGMNVSLFEDFPDIGWYFLAAIILLLIVLLLWYGVKHSLQRRRQTAYQRGIYERLFTQLSDEHPTLWSPNGARDDIEVEPSSRLKWRLLRRWFSPQRTIDKKLYNSLDPDSGLGSWATFKSYLLRRWLSEIKPRRQHDADPLSAAELASANTSFENRSPTPVERAKIYTPIFFADAEPGAAQEFPTYGLRPLSSVEGQSSDERPGSHGSNGIMIEERNLSDLESDHAAESRSQSGRP